MRARVCVCVCVTVRVCACVCVVHNPGAVSGVSVQDPEDWLELVSVVF